MENEMASSKADENQPAAWPKEDEIRWVEWRIREREAIEAGRTPQWAKRGSCSQQEYSVWLLHVKDGRSFQHIGESMFASYAGPENQKMRAYRAYDRVEAEFNRGRGKRAKKPELGFVLTAYGLMMRRE